jgi:bifunctional DNase/RNase
MTDKIKMIISGLTIDPFTNMPIVILKDAEGKVALPVWIGLIEASAIATEFEHIEAARPMTHDLMKKILEELNAQVHHVEITDLVDNTFFAEIHVVSGPKTFVLDCRPSDALAIAIRMKADILVHHGVIDKTREIQSAQHSTDHAQEQKWAEILESLEPEDFGKYKM